MSRYSRTRQVSHLSGRYPGEWAFILCAKLASSAPVEQEQRRMSGEKREEREQDHKNHEGLNELLDKVEQGEISTGTHHLHASVTVDLGLSATATGGTRDPVITGDESDESDDGNSDNDGETSVDGDSDGGESPTPISDAARNQTNPTLAPPDLDGNGSGNPLLSSGRNGPDAGAIAGSVIGALLAIALLVGLFIFRTRIRQKIISFRGGEGGRGSRSRSTYNRMGPTPTPDADPTDKEVVITRFVDPKPAMSERTGPVSTLFGSKESTTNGGDILAGLPAPAMIRYSTTTSRRESRNARYVRQSILLRNGGGDATSPEFYNPTSFSSPPFRNRSQSPPFRTRSRANSDRFPIAIPPTTTISATSPVSPPPSTTTTSPTIAPSEIDDSFFHALSQPKLPIQAPQPIAAIPAFLIPETPVEPKDSRFSWSTNQTRRTQPPVPTMDTPVIGTGIAAGRVSMAESEQRFRGVNSWVSNQRGRLERSRSNSGGMGGVVGVGGEVRQSQMSLPPQTPTEFRQHPGREVSYGASGQRIMSEELDRVLNVNGNGNGSSVGRMV